jgi:16S rRNA (cytidine1402-2'-O)-methyltransferase
MPADPIQPPPPALSPGLYLVATPIGAARDITLRALDILAAAEVLAAEDTRTLRKLMDIHGIALAGRPLVAYHDHNDATARPRLLAALAAGKSVAYAPEAGTPMVSDPGYRLVREAAAAGYPVLSAPGASAVLAALTVAGLPTDRFLFAGFAPPKRAARRSFLEGLADIPATVVLYEAPGRIGELLTDLCDTFGGMREAAVCRELTKRFETVERGSLLDLSRAFAGRAVRGEIVVLVDRAAPVVADDDAVERALRRELDKGSLRDATDAVARALSLPRREVYRKALAMTERDTT